MIEMKICGKWHKLQTMDEIVNPEYFMIAWDFKSLSFAALNHAWFNETRETFRINGADVECFVKLSASPILRPRGTICCAVTLTPLVDTYQNNGIMPASASG